MDAEEKEKRGKLAKNHLSLIQEHLDKRREELFQQFIDPRNVDELFELKADAVALTNLEDYLQELINSGKLAKANQQGEI